MKNTATQAGRNGGRLKVGNPGNSGGGRRPDQLRAMARDSLEKCLARLEERLDDPDLATSDIVRITELLLKYGIGPAQSESMVERPNVPFDAVYGFG